MMTRQQAEELIHLLRYIVNNSFETTQKNKDFNPEAHNLCMLHCEFNGLPDETFFSYSGMTAFSKGAIRKLNESWGLEFVPDVAPHLLLV